MTGSALYLFLGFMLGAFGAWFMARYAFALGLVDLPNSRSSHSTPTPRGGGIGLLFAFIVAAVMANVSLSLWLPAACLALVSFFDDRLELSPKLRLFFQFASAVVVVLGASYPGISMFSLVLIPFWVLFIVGTANFYNFMDGINGIAGITGVLGFSFVALFAYMIQADNSLTMLSLALAAACAGFLPFNIPGAKVFMGDVGSVLLGFVAATLIFYFSRNLASLICLVSFFFPFYADTLVTLFIRWRNGERLSQAHRRHLYQLLCNELNLPHWIVATGFGTLQLIIAGLMLCCYNFGVHWQGAFILVITFLFVSASLKVRKVVARSV